MYVKLFAKILDSSIWLESDQTRIVWITLLAAMDEQFIARFSSVGNVAVRARVPVEEAEAAIRLLESPDKHNREQDFEGRRIERIGDGWLILNGEKYASIVTREVMRERTRQRVAEHRKRTAEAACNAPVTARNVHVTQLDKDIELDKDAKSLSDYPSDNPHPAAAGIPAIRAGANKAKAENKAAKAKALQDAWNELADPRLPRWKEMPAARQRAALARLSERGLDTLRELIQRMNKIRFLVGENDRGWRASPDWFLKPGSIAAIVEGKHDRPETPAEKNRRMEKEMEEANHRAGIEFRAKVEAARKAREEKRAAESAIRPEP